jgi:hypothetical protein
MHSINFELLKLAQARTGSPVYDFQSLIKQAVVAPADPNAPPPGVDPAAAGGMPPGAMPPGGAPGAPPMDPAMLAAMGGAAPAGMPAPVGMPPAVPTPMDPAAQAAGGAAPAAAAPAKPPKAEDWLPKLDMRLYNLQQMMSAIINHMGISIPPEALIMPPGTTTPQMEQAMPQPGMPPANPPMDPAAMAAGGGDPMAAAGGAPSPADPSQGKTASNKQLSLMEMLFADTNAVSSRAEAIAALLRVTGS